MKQLFLQLLTLITLAGCSKDQRNTGPQVDIYLLKSFTTTVNQSTTPATISITNAALENTPLVTNKNISAYIQATHKFILNKDIQTAIANFGPDKAFAVTVDKQPIYYGLFHPTYLSSINFGVATISPILVNNNELQIDFPTIDNNSLLQQLDLRNDSQLIQALKMTNRLQ